MGEQKRKHFYLDSTLQIIQCHFSYQASVQQIKYEIRCNHGNSYYQDIQRDLLHMLQLKQKVQNEIQQHSYTQPFYSPQKVLSFSKCSYPIVSDSKLKQLLEQAGVLSKS